jgi:hypothetical protein
MAARTDAQREHAEQEWKTLARELTDEQHLRECRPERHDALETAEVVELVGAGVRIRVLHLRLEHEMPAAIEHLHGEDGVVRDGVVRHAAGERWRQDRGMQHDLLQSGRRELREAELEPVRDRGMPGAIALELIHDGARMTVHTAGHHLVDPVGLVRLGVPGKRVEHPPSHGRRGRVTAGHERRVPQVEAEEVAGRVPRAKKV